MPRRVFFSFHYEEDALRASQVRQSQQFLKSNEEFTGYIDAADWEAIERAGDATIKRWIQQNLDRTSVTAVLFGAKTATRRWVRYELLESVQRGNGLLAVDIHGLKDPRSGVAAAGKNPLDSIGFTIDRAKKVVTLLEYDYQKAQWVYPRDTSSTMQLRDFPYRAQVDNGKFSSVGLVMDFSLANAGQKFPEWIEAAARAVGKG